MFREAERDEENVVKLKTPGSHKTCVELLHGLFPTVGCPEGPRLAVAIRCGAIDLLTFGSPERGLGKLTNLDDSPPSMLDATMSVNPCCDDVPPSNFI